jgi:hypothetical protein
VKLGAENKRNVILAAVLGAVAVIVVIAELMPSSSTSASSSPVASTNIAPINVLSRSTTKRGPKAAAPKKEHLPPSLDPTLHLQQLEAIEEIKYEGSGRNIFVSQADVEIPVPNGTGATDHPVAATVQAPVWTAPTLPPPQPIPLKFFGFANQPGEPKRVFLSKGEDVFIAGEGEIIDRRYKVVRITQNAVEIQDVVGSGPAQNIPLTQG